MGYLVEYRLDIEDTNAVVLCTTSTFMLRFMGLVIPPVDGFSVLCRRTNRNALQGLWRKSKEHTSSLELCADY